MWMVIKTILVLGIAAGFISLTVTKSTIFEPFRDFFFHRSEKSAVMKFLYDLVTCPYCFSHWVSLVMVCIWQPRIVNCGCIWVDLGVSWFVMVGIASYAWGIFFKITSEDSESTT
jgi:ribosomal protein L37AE/L43A